MLCPIATFRDSHLQLQLENKMAEVHVAVRQNNVTARLSCSFGAQGGEHVITLPLYVGLHLTIGVTSL